MRLLTRPPCSAKSNIHLNAYLFGVGADSETHRDPIKARWVFAFVGPTYHSIPCDNHLIESHGVLVNMLNPHARRAIGKSAADLYDAGNRQESLYLLRKLAEASEWYRGETVPPPGWGEIAEVGRSRGVRTISNRRAAANGR